MKIRILAVICLTSACCTCLAESFFLKHDKTGKLYGPYASKEGSKVVIGNTSFTVVKSKDVPSALEKKMSLIIIPKIAFRTTTVRDVLAFLQEASVEFDSSDVPEKEKGIRMILNVPPPAGADPFGSAPDIPTVTLSLKNVSLLNAVRYITELTGLTTREKDGILFLDKKKRDRQQGRQSGWPKQ